MKITNYFSSLKTLFEEHRVPEDAVRMKSYMKNLFEFYGVKSPLRKEILRTHTKSYPVPEGDKLKELVTLMWEDPHRELQYAAMDLMAKKTRKMDNSWFSFFENLILTKSWWDTVDWIAPNGSGRLFQKYPKQILPITNRWNSSDNIWLQRSSIIFQLKYRHETDFDLMKVYILEHASSKEFFVRKASGWAIRQYSKYNPLAVSDFIGEHKDQLSGLTIREGLKWLEKNT